MLSQIRILNMMSRTLRNLYITSSRYIFCLSEGLLLWVLTLVGHIFGKFYNPRKSPKLRKVLQARYVMNSKTDNNKGGEENGELNGSNDDDSDDDDDDDKDAADVDEDNNVFSIRKCKNWFESNVKHSQHPNEMNEEDVIRFCHEINKDLEDVVLLVLAYKMNATRIGFFTIEEWLRGMKELEIDSTSKLLVKWEWLRSLLDDKTFLRNVYRFSFKFSRNPDRRNLEMYLCQGLIKIFFENRWILVDNFIEFLSSTKYTIMTFDEFCSVYEFQEYVKDDLSNYDFEGAWPILLDDFVVYTRQNTNLEHHVSEMQRQL